MMFSLQSVYTKTIALVLTVGLSTSLAACGQAEPNRYHPHSRSDQVPELVKRNGSTTSSDMNMAESTTTIAQPEPITINGRQIQPTTPGAKLRFGKKAIIVTENLTDRFFAWSVTVNNGARVEPDALMVNETEDSEYIDHYQCTTYNMIFLGAFSFNDDDFLMVSGPEDKTHSAVPAPSFTSVTAMGEEADIVSGNIESVCGIDEHDRIPALESDLHVGVTYRGALLSVVYQEITEEEMPAAIYYEYDDETLPPIQWR
ncbi:hypothetical protein ACFLIN_04770 [Corynebacterium kutscheri]|uniref:hypothetical protein n=1 Tax=Corynebacterium kutscheri TaxID=35755 RepID=UPI0037C1936A